MSRSTAIVERGTAAAAHRAGFGKLNMKFLIPSFLALSAATHVTAQTMVTDTDGSGAYSMEELTAVFPALTQQQFIGADTNGNGEISLEELARAVESGKFPA